MARNGGVWKGYGLPQVEALPDLLDNFADWLTREGIPMAKAEYRDSFVKPHDEKFDRAKYALLQASRGSSGSPSYSAAARILNGVRALARESAAAPYITVKRETADALRKFYQRFAKKAA